VVTGGAGFVGSHLVDALLDAEDEVTVIDHLSGGHSDNLAGALARGTRLITADVRDVDAMVSSFARVRPDVVYHLAAQIDVRRSVSDPSTDAHVNVGGTAAVLEASRNVGARRVLLASTAGVYGDPHAIPTPETAPVAPLSPYGTSKTAAENYMQLFRRLHGLSTLSLRMSNVYGPRQDPHGEAGVVAIFCRLAASGESATIFGDGAQTRDFIYVTDVVDAFRAAGRSSAEGIVNVATGRETALARLADELRLSTTYAASRPGETQRSCLDPSRARRTLGWRPRVGLQEGLRRTLMEMAVPEAVGAP
jgi:UDP-glucose 4-epimerase